MKTVIMVSGAMKSGKTTFSNMLFEELRRLGKDPDITPFAKPLKDLCASTFAPLVDYINREYGQDITLENWFEFKHPITRMILQIVGTDLIRKNVQEHFWVNKYIFNTLRVKDNDFFIIPDWRFKNERAWLKKEAHDRDIRLITIKVAGPKRVEDDGVTDHQSENDLKGMIYTNTILNYADLPTLRKGADDLAQILIKGEGGE